MTFDVDDDNDVGDDFEDSLCSGTDQNTRDDSNNLIYALDTRRNGHKILGLGGMYGVKI